MPTVKRLQIIARSLVRTLRQSPERAAKQQLVREYARRAHIHVMIETGTYLGDMVEATRLHFREVHSIELDEELHRWARWRFRKFPNIHLYRGDSGTLLPVILSSIQEPCLFWLDAHYSGGITATSQTTTPIATELRAILLHRPGGHIILIDDAECFTGADGYPSLDDIRQIARGWNVESTDGIIRIAPAYLATIPR